MTQTYQAADLGPEGKPSGAYAEHAPFGVLSRDIVQRSSALSRRAIRVLMGLSTYMRGPGKWFKLRIRTLATMLDYAYETVRAALRELRKTGLVEAEATFYARDGHAAQGANRYRVVFGEAPAVTTSVDEDPLDVAIRAAVDEWALTAAEAATTQHEEQMQLWRDYSEADPVAAAKWKPAEPAPIDAWAALQAKDPGLISHIVQHVHRRWPLDPPRNRAIGRAVRRVLAVEGARHE